MSATFAPRLPASVQHTNQPQALTPALTQAQPALCAMITQDPKDIKKAQRLRYRVFANEMGADLQGDGLDADRFDQVCLHLIVRDEDTLDVVGYSRILTQDLAARVGGYYSETEFDLTRVLKTGKTYMEIGRTCVDPDYRSGAVIALLWAKLGQFMMEHQIDFLMGCASIPYRPFSDSSQELGSILSHLRQQHFTPQQTRAVPKRPVPTGFTPKALHEDHGKRLLPPLLKAYLRMGCDVCGEPHWDESFGVVDLLVLLDRNKINHRYLKHFLRDA